MVQIVNVTVPTPESLANSLPFIPSGADFVRLTLDGQPGVTVVHATSRAMVQQILSNLALFGESGTGMLIEEDFGGPQLVLQPATSADHQTARPLFAKYMQERHGFAISRFERGLETAFGLLAAGRHKAYDIYNDCIQSAINDIYYGGQFENMAAFMAMIQTTVLLVNPAAQAKMIRRQYGDGAVPENLLEMEAAYTALVGQIKTAAKTAYRQAMEQGAAGTFWEVLHEHHQGDEDRIASEIFGMGVAQLDTVPTMLNSATYVLGADIPLQDRIRLAAQTNNKRELNAFNCLVHIVMPAVLATSRGLLVDWEGFTAGTDLQVNFVRALRDTLLPEFDLDGGIDLDFLTIFEHILANLDKYMEIARLAYGGESSPKECLGRPLGWYSVYALSMKLIDNRIPQIDRTQCSFGGIVMTKVEMPELQFEPAA